MFTSTSQCANLKEVSSSISWVKRAESQKLAGKDLSGPLSRGNKMANTIDERVNELEHFKTRALAILSVLAALGIGVAGYAAYVSGNIQNAQTQLETLEGRVTALQQRIPIIPDLVEASIAERVNIDLSDGWSSTSVLAQVQAQAICTSIATNEARSIRAVFRRAISDGEEFFGLACSEVCRNVKSFGGRSPIEEGSIITLGAVHVYEDFEPQDFSVQEGPVVGLNTYLYSSWEGSGFGPNYCCCGYP